MDRRAGRSGPRSPRAALRRGLAYLPEDRLRQGLVQPMSIATNVSLAVLPELTPGRAPAPAARAARSPGGSWSSCGSRRPRRPRSCAASPAATSRRSCSPSGSPPSRAILILDEPTHGVDVGTKADVHRTISHLATQGLTILLISSELPEVLGMSDRVLVMREGRLVAELSRAEATAGADHPGRGRRARRPRDGRSAADVAPHDARRGGVPAARARDRRRARRSRSLFFASARRTS